jgi:hypothetical protein
LGSFVFAPVVAIWAFAVDLIPLVEEEVQAGVVVKLEFSVVVKLEFSVAVKLE